MMAEDGLPLPRWSGPKIDPPLLTQSGNVCRYQMAKCQALCRYIPCDPAASAGSIEAMSA